MPNKLRMKSGTSVESTKSKSAGGLMRRRLLICLPGSDCRPSEQKVQDDPFGSGGISFLINTESWWEELEWFMTGTLCWKPNADSGSLSFNLKRQNPNRQES